MGLPHKVKNTMPRDILVCFADLRSRQQLLLEACTKDFLMNGSSISVFPDLSVETLEACRQLCPVTSLLSKHNHRYRWVAHAKILMQHKGTSLLLADIDSGTQLLTDLGIEIPSDFPHLDTNTEHPVWKPF